MNRRKPLEMKIRVLMGPTESDVCHIISSLKDAHINILSSLKKQTQFSHRYKRPLGTGTHTWYMVAFSPSQECSFNASSIAIVSIQVRIAKSDLLWLGRFDSQMFVHDNHSNIVLAYSAQVDLQVDWVRRPSKVSDIHRTYSLAEKAESISGRDAYKVSPG